MGLAVLRCLDTRITAIGEQLRVGVAHFFAKTKLAVLQKISENISECGIFFRKDFVI